MALLITLFLVLINIFNNITTNSPKAEGLTAIEIWMLACILFVFGSLIGKVQFCKQKNRKTFVSKFPIWASSGKVRFILKLKLNFPNRIRSYLIPEAKSEQIWCTIPIHLRRKGHGGRCLGLRDAFGSCRSHFSGVRIGQNRGQFFFNKCPAASKSSKRNNCKVNSSKSKQSAKSRSTEWGDVWYVRTC